ncbi:hypothetical protein GOP47_0013532 [Adiantum capillus-veneris]|uniref:Uncharacterized protein n=1 Tax=Adiantum capillus-veneris TaxID=13818 RepID=A0A9D4UPE3_ADICA|nr:hypothetical protein GOP47_0013532 [Adiantum capillus-veneris]
MNCGLRAAAIDPASDLLISPSTNVGRSHSHLVDRPAIRHSPVVKNRNTLQAADPFATMRTTDPAVGTGHESGLAIVKAKTKKHVPVSSVRRHEKLQKLDLSLETYAQVLLAVEQGPPLLDKSCSLQSLRKVLSANHLSNAGLSKEFITLHSQKLRLFKPFLSSLSCANKTLQVRDMALNYTEVVEDLNALEWLDYGRVHVAPDSECILGRSAKEPAGILSLTCCPTRDSSFGSHMANSPLPSCNEQHYNTHKAVSLAAPQVENAKSSNATEVLCFLDCYNGHRHEDSLFCGSDAVVNLECQSFFGSRSVGACACASATPDKIRHKAGCEMEGIEIESDPPKSASPATSGSVEQTSRPTATHINRGKDVQVARVCTSVTQINVGQALDGTSQKLQLGLSSTMKSQLSHRLESALICSPENASARVEYEGSVPYLSESRKGENVQTLRSRMLLQDEPASQISQPAYLQNLLNGTEITNVRANTQSSPNTDIVADHEVVYLSCSQDLNRKEDMLGSAAANIQSPSVASKVAELPRFQHYELIVRVEKEDGKEIQSKEAPTRKRLTETDTTNAANVSSNSHFTMAHPDVENASVMNADVMIINDIQAEESRRSAKIASKEDRREQELILLEEEAERRRRSAKWRKILKGS